MPTCNHILTRGADVTLRAVVDLESVEPDVDGVRTIEILAEEQRAFQASCVVCGEYVDIEMPKDD